MTSWVRLQACRALRPQWDTEAQAGPSSELLKHSPSWSGLKRQVRAWVARVQRGFQQLRSIHFVNVLAAAAEIVKST